MDDKILKKVQMVQLEIAREIKRVCEKNNLTVFLSCGTLLGAIRHKGFIPWDDDLDMGMLRDDYKKFILIANKELDKKYSMIEWRSDIEYPHPMIKVVKNGTILKEKKRKDNSNHGIWVDIFPFDHVPNNKKERNWQKKEIMFYRAIARAKCHCATWYLNDKILFRKWVKNLPIRFLSLFFTKKYAAYKYEYAAEKFNDLPCNNYYDNGCDSYDEQIIPEAVFDGVIEVEFEGEKFWAPKGYELYLKTIYGNYMKLPPVEKRQNRHMIETISFGNE